MHGVTSDVVNDVHAERLDPAPVERRLLVPVRDLHPSAGIIENLPDGGLDSSDEAVAETFAASFELVGLVEVLIARLRGFKNPPGHTL